jgi:phosphoribosyl 1,2-cyclic phosphodiesterase
MRVVSLGSGSSGNALLVEAGPQGRTKLLVDAGLSIRVLSARLQSVGVVPAQLRGILITHEHSDHVQAVPTLSRRYHIPIIADPRTLAVLENNIVTGAWSTDSGRPAPIQAETVLPDTLSSHSFDSRADDIAGLASTEDSLFISTSAVTAPSVLNTYPFPIGSTHAFGDIEVTSFPISHDAIAPCGYLLTGGGFRVCIVTDSGEITPVMFEKMQSADLLIVESNHDRDMLIRGPYPWSLKKRILSSTGHLANDQTADAVLRLLMNGGPRWLWLAHLSRTNNTPELALANMQASLRAARINPTSIHLSALPHTIGTVWDSTLLWY